MYKFMRKIYTFVIPYQEDVMYILLGGIKTVFVIPWQSQPLRGYLKSVRNTPSIYTNTS